MAITWRNVTGPDFGTAGSLIKSGGSAIQDAFKGFADIANQQRDINIFNQGEERKADIQAGKEAILGSTGTLEDWKKSDLNKMLEPYADTETRSELFDYFNQRDDILRDETKADLSIASAEQTIRHAEAQEKRAWADEKRKDTRLGIAVAENGRAQQMHNFRVHDILEQRSYDDALTTLHNQLYNMMDGETDDAKLQAKGEELINAKDANGKFLFGGKFRNQANKELGNIINQFNSLTTTEQSELATANAKTSAKYANQGIGFDAQGNPEPGLNQLNYGIELNNEAIQNYQNTEKSVAESVKQYGDIGTYVNSKVKGNNKAVIEQIGDSVDSITPKIVASVKSKLKARGIPDNVIDKQLAGYKVPEAFKLHVLQHQPITTDFEFLGEDETDILGNWYGGNDFSNYKKDLTNFAVDQLVAKLEADKAKADNLVLGTKVSKINSQITKETNDARLAIINRNKNIKNIKGTK